MDGWTDLLTSLVLHSLLLKRGPELLCNKPDVFPTLVSMKPWYHAVPIPMLVVCLLTGNHGDHGPCITSLEYI